MGVVCKTLPVGFFVGWRFFMNESWIKLYRKFKKWEWYKNSIVKDVFIELLLNVNFKNKRWQGIEIKRGQLITSVSHLVEGLNNNPKKPTITTQNIRTALDRLKSTNEITIASTPNYTLITINKFEDYQKVTNKLTNDQQTTNKRLTTTKEYKNIKNDKNVLSVYSKNSTLSSILEVDLVEISNRYSVPVSFVRSKLDDLTNWHEKNPQKNQYKNYLSALREWVKRDSLKIKEKYDRTSKISVVNTDES